MRYSLIFESDKVLTRDEYARALAIASYRVSRGEENEGAIYDLDDSKTVIGMWRLERTDTGQSYP